MPMRRRACRSTGRSTGAWFTTGSNGRSLRARLAVQADRQCRRGDHVPTLISADGHDRRQAVKVDGRDARGAAQDEGAPGRHKDDKQAQQQALMKLYQEEKIIRWPDACRSSSKIPIWYALYKVLLLTIEMRHQPFALWIKDRRHRPMTPINLFGYLPFTRCPSGGRGAAESSSASPCSSVQAQPQAPDDPAAGLFDQALGADVRDGSVCRRTAALLGNQHNCSPSRSRNGCTTAIALKAAMQTK